MTPFSGDSLSYLELRRYDSRQDCTTIADVTHGESLKVAGQVCPVAPERGVGPGLETGRGRRRGARAHRRFAEPHLPRRVQHPLRRRFRSARQARYVVVFFLLLRLISVRKRATHRALAYPVLYVHYDVTDAEMLDMLKSLNLKYSNDRFVFTVADEQKQQEFKVRR